MTQFKFFLSRFSYGRRARQHRKVVVFKSENATKAWSYIQATYPDWQINMFWPIWP